MDRNLQVLRFHNPGRAFVGRRCARPITLALLRCILSVACYGQGTVPVADFTASPTSGGAPLTVQFTDTSAGDITRWLWNFGDSLTSAHRNPTHEYATAGTYTVTLTVTGSAGSDTETKAGYIVLPPEGLPPVAHMALEPSANVEVGEEVFFSAQASTDDKSLVAGRFEWDFGDGYSLKYGHPLASSMDSGISCTHFFMRPGEYTVTLTVTDIDTYQGTTTTPINVTGEAPLEGFELWHAPFHARIAQYIYAQIPEIVYSDPANQLRVTLESDQGYSAVLVTKAGLASEEASLLRNSELPAGNYVLTAQLLNAGDTRLSVIREQFPKPYDGMPHVGINENNAICINGEPFFPVTPFILDESRMPTWSAGRYINTLYAPGYYLEGHTLGTWRRYLDGAIPYGWRVIGPIERWGGYAGMDPYFGGRSPNSRNSDVSKLANYVTQTKDHSALFTWVWMDEPNMGGRNEYVPAPVYESWAYKTRQIDSQHPVGVTLYGYDYLPYYDGRRPQHADKYTFLKNANDFGGRKTCVVDFTGFDIYPLEYQHHPSLVDFTRGVMDLYAEAIDRMINSNYGLIPATTFIETQDLGEQPGTAGPTAAQLKMEIWLNVVHGVKSIGWFHYFEPTPIENFAVMAEFLDQITELTPIVLDAEPARTVTDNANTRGCRVDTMIRETDSDVYVFAVRVTEPETEWVEQPEPESVTVEFQVQGIEDTTLAVFDEGRTLPVTSGSFTDTFPREAVHIYRIPKGADSPVMSDVAGWKLY